MPLGDGEKLRLDTFLYEAWLETEPVSGAKRTWVLDVDDDVDDTIMFPEIP